MPRTGNLRQSCKWISYTQFLGRKNGDIKIVVTEKFCYLIEISLNVLVIIWETACSNNGNEVI